MGWHGQGVTGEHRGVGQLTCAGCDLDGGGEPARGTGCSTPPRNPGLRGGGKSVIVYAVLSRLV